MLMQRRWHMQLSGVDVGVSECPLYQLPFVDSRTAIFLPGARCAHVAYSAVAKLENLLSIACFRGHRMCVNHQQLRIGLLVRGPVLGGLCAGVRCHACEMVDLVMTSGDVWDLGKAVSLRSKGGDNKIASI